MRRTPMAALTAAGLALALAACGSSSDGSTTTSSKSVDPAKISGTVTWWDTSDAKVEAPTFKALIAQFQAQYPNVKVNYVNVPFADAQNKFATAAQSGNGAPDVIRSDVGWVTQWASQGYLAPLDGTYAVDNPGDYLPNPLSSTKYNGKTYALPQVTDTLALLYNKDLLKKAGHDTPPATMDQLKQYALDVKAKEPGVSGLTLNVDAYFLLPFIYGEGGNLVDSATKKITIADPAATAGIQRVADLIKAGAAPKPAITDSYTAAETAFKSGKTAMIFNGPWSMTDNLTGTAFKDAANLGVAPVPAGSAKAGAPVGGHDYAVYAGSKNLDADYAFVRFMSSAQSQATVAGKLGLLPTRTSAYSLPEASGSALVKEFQPLMSTTVPRAWIPEAGLLFDPLLTQYQNLVTGKADAAAATKATADKYKNILKGWS
jgi:arabinogalactan oligomer/maltooligosaccharide transport system substrate-binding protein